MIRSEFKRFYLSKPCLGEGCSRRVVGSFLLALLLMGIGNITLADGILGTVKEKFQELSTTGVGMDRLNPYLNTTM